MQGVKATVNRSPFVATLLGLVQLIATPQNTLFDTPVHIVAATSTADARVTIEARTTIDGTSYRSWGSYATDATGAVDLSKAAPLHGTYTGIDPMGLFWSMEPTASAGYTPASLLPIDVRLTLYTGRGTATVILRRSRIAAKIARLPLQNEPIVGTWFIHEDGSARGVVVVLGGSEGGMDENRAAIIASHGFDSLALAYFGVSPLPAELANIPLEYVDRAIDWVRKQPELRNLPIVLEGDSKGSELALLVAAHNPSVKGVVAFAPSSSVFEGFSTKQGAQRASWTLSGAPMPFANNPVPPSVKVQIQAERRAKRPVSFRDQYLALATPADVESTIPVSQIAGPVLLVAGEDDQLWPSDIFADRIIAMRKANGARYPDEILLYPHAGHQIDVPYLPTTDLAVFDERSFLLALGGTPSGYARADEDMWPKVIGFMRSLCPVKASVRRSE